MELLDAINTNGTCRYYTEQPVDGDLIVRLLQAAQKGPSGSNRQPVQFLVVRDAQKRQAIADLYLPIWDKYMEKAQSGEWKVGGNNKFLERADHFARNMAKVPVHLVVCFNIDDIQPITCVEIVNRPFAVRVKRRFVDCHIHCTPPHVVYRIGIANNVFIFW